MSIFIKPLAWDQYDRADIYHVKPTYGGGPKAFMLSRASRIFSVFFDTVDEAKAAAEADYTSRIRSALVATPPAERVVEALAQTIREQEVQWAVGRWHAEVENRPLVNVHRRSLDDTWRQVIRHFGGDPEALCGPSHDDLLAAQEQGRS